MPLKLLPPDRAKGEASYYIRGSYLGVKVRRSAGTDRPALAGKELKRIEREIEDGRFAEPRAAEVATFSHAAVGYLKTCPLSQVPRVQKLLRHFAETPLDAFTKDAVDEGELVLYPEGLKRFAAGTLNKEYRTPLAAVLHHAADRGLMTWLRVAKHKERQTTRWLEADEALRLIRAARDVDAQKERHRDARLAPLLIALFTCNLRISEACAITWSDVNLARREVRLWDTKNGESYTRHLGDLAFEAIANLPGWLPTTGRKEPARDPGRKIFGFRDRHAVKYSLAKACEKVGLVKRDPRTGEILRDAGRRAKTTFTLHQARHSFATWLRREGVDLKALAEIGGWKDMKSVARYSHVAADEHAAAIAKLPINPRKKESA